MQQNIALKLNVNALLIFHLLAIERFCIWKKYVEMSHVKLSCDMGIQLGARSITGLCCRTSVLQRTLTLPNIFFF